MSETVATVTIPSAADYASADRAGKAAIRTSVTKVMEAAIDALDMDVAKAARDALRSYTSSAPEKAEIDYIGLVAQKVANLRMAANLLETGTVRPSDVPADTDLSAVRSRVNGDLTAATPITGTSADTDVASAMASAKIARSTKQHDWDAIIIAYFADAPVGTWASCNTIAKSVDASASVGAVAAASTRFETPRDGVVFTPKSAERANGYTKV